MSSRNTTNFIHVISTVDVPNLQRIHDKDHFTSLHGKAGCIVLAFSCGTLLLGLFSFRKMGFLERFPQEWQSLLKWLHRYMGATTFTLALVVMQLDLPHVAVMEGFLCRSWQLATRALGVLLLLLLRHAPPGKPALPVMNQAMVPQEAQGMTKHL